MVNWRNTRLPKLEEKSEIEATFDMVTHHIHELGFQYCSFTMSSQLPNKWAVAQELSKGATDRKSVV